MKAVVLMAGKGSRMAKDYSVPKQLLEVDGKTVIERSLSRLPKEVDEFVFVVGGPHEDAIRAHFRSHECCGRKVVFVRQDEPKGTAHAFSCAKEVVGDERWLGLMGDDLLGPKGLTKLLECDLGLLAYRVERPESFGVLVVNEKGMLTDMVEKPSEFISDLAWTGAMIMDTSFFDIEVSPSSRGEYEAPDVFLKLCEQGRDIQVVEAEFWLPINDKEQFLSAKSAFGA